MKRVISFLTLALLLPACGGGGSETTTGDSDQIFYHSYKTAEFEIDVPDDWETINSFTSDYPESIRIAFRNNIKEGDYVANLTIFKEENPKSQLNTDLSQEYLKKHAESLVNYKLLEQEEISLQVLGSPSQTILNTFEGKNDTRENTITFKQTYAAEGDTTWLITASYYAPTEDEFVIERLETMIKSFTVQ